MPRTTVTLDEDVAIRLAEEQEKRGASFKDTVNALLRAGLDATNRRDTSRTDLAALAMEHGLTLCSTDGDCARFPGRRWENPLAP